MDLKVKLPMIVKTDSKSTVDQFNSWSVSDHTHHSKAKMMWLHELKEEGVLQLEWQPSEENAADMFTKNLGGPLFNKHVGVYVGQDEYVTKYDHEESQGKGVSSCCMQLGHHHDQ